MRIQKRKREANEEGGKREVCEVTEASLAWGMGGEVHGGKYLTLSDVPLRVERQTEN